MLITLGATLICEILSYLIQLVVFRLSFEIFVFLKIISIETLYNIIIVIIIYPLMKKSGEVLTRIFNEKNVLTKYY